MRIVALLGIVGIWQSASLLHGSLAVTALFTAAAAVLGAWAIATLRAQ